MQGGSIMLNTRFQKMAEWSKIASPDELEKEISALSEALGAAQASKCPAPLAMSSLNILLMSRNQPAWPWA